jgi:hypothetical protein
MNLPIQAQPVMRGVSSSKLTDKTITPSACDEVLCGVAVAACIAECYFSGPACIPSCLGTLYPYCKDCL